MDRGSPSGEGIGAALADGWQALVQWSRSTSNDPFNACWNDGLANCAGDGDYSPPPTRSRSKRDKARRQRDEDDVTWVAYTWLNTPARRHQLGERANKPPPRLYTPPSTRHSAKMRNNFSNSSLTPPVTPPHNTGEDPFSTALSLSLSEDGNSGRWTTTPTATARNPCPRPHPPLEWTATTTPPSFNCLDQKHKQEPAGAGTKGPVTHRVARAWIWMVDSVVAERWNEVLVEIRAPRAEQARGGDGGGGGDGNYGRRGTGLKKER